VLAGVVLVAASALGSGAADQASAQESSPGPVAAALEQALVDAIARAERSVVSIARVRAPEQEGFSPSDRRGDFDGRFDGRLEGRFDGRFDASRPEERSPPSPNDPDFIPNEFATGVVIDVSGLVLTNAHVLAPDCTYWIYTADRRAFEAIIIAADPRSDLAVLRADGGGDSFEPIAFGDGSAVRKGQFVAALGNPYAIARDGQVSASWGIVSNLGRKAAPQEVDADGNGKTTLHHYGTLIQTDARLNLGTSGGALINLRGEMIGLTTSQAALSGYEQPAGFAIPVDDVFLRAVEAMKKGGPVEYGFLGIQPKNVVGDERYGGRAYVSVEAVRTGTPAHRADLLPSDRILAIDGERIADTDQLLLELGRRTPGAVAALTVERQGSVLQKRITLAKYPVSDQAIVTSPPPAWRGLHVDYPTAHKVWESAVLVIAVDEGSLGWNAGLRQGDLITHVGNLPVESPVEFRREADDDSVEMKLRVKHAAGPAEIVTVPAGDAV
jgi:S1-C subfamily serine protease